MYLQLKKNRASLGKNKIKFVTIILFSEHFEKNLNNFLSR